MERTEQNEVPLDIEDNPVVKADVAVATEMTRYKDHPVAKAAATVGEILDQPPLFTACGAVVAWGLVTRDRELARLGANMLASAVLATWIKGGIKSVVARPRPNILPEVDGHEVSLMGPNEGPWNSFPSGHTAGGMAVARAIARARPELGPPAYAALAALVVARLPEGGHYPLDLLAGAVVGAVAEAAVARVSPLT
jgi:membrane-associated phospholipid phosphatase